MNVPLLNPDDDDYADTEQGKTLEIAPVDSQTSSTTTPPLSENNGWISVTSTLEELKDITKEARRVFREGAYYSAQILAVMVSDNFMWLLLGPEISIGYLMAKAAYSTIPIFYQAFVISMGGSSSASPTSSPSPTLSPLE